MLGEEKKVRSFEEICKEQNELLREIKDRQEVNQKVLEKKAEYQKEFDSFQKRLNEIDRSTNKNDSAIEHLQRKAALQQSLIDGQESVFKKNIEIIKEGMEKVRILENEKAKFSPEEKALPKASFPSNSSFIIKVLSSIKNAFIAFFSPDKFFKPNLSDQETKKSRGCFLFNREKVETEVKKESGLEVGPGSAKN